MSFSAAYKLDKVVLPSSVEFTDVQNARAAPEIESLLSSPAGHPWPMFLANAGYKPVVSFTTRQLDVALAAIGAGGLEVTTDSYLYFAEATATGKTARATTNHVRVVVAECLAFWTRGTLPHNGEGTIDVVLAASWDGTNNPLVMGGSVALSGNLTSGNRFGAGPVSVNGSAVGGVQAVEFASNVRLIEAGGESDPYNSFVGLEAGAPTVDVSYIGADALTTFGLGGTKLNGSTGIVAYGRKFDANGDRVANGTAEHLYVQGLLGRLKVIEAAAQGAQLGINRIQAECVASSDSVLPLVAATTQAIS